MVNPERLTIFFDTPEEMILHSCWAYFHIAQDKSSKRKFLKKTYVDLKKQKIIFLYARIPYLHLKLNALI